MAREAIKKNRKCRCANLKSYVVVMLVLFMALASCAGPAERVAEGFVQELHDAAEQRVRDMAEAIAVDPNMGDWQGRWTLDDGSDSGPLVAQVIALGQGKYRAKFLDQCNDRVPAIALLEGQLKDGKVRFSGPGRY